MKIEIYVGDFWYEVTVSDVERTGYIPARLHGHPDTWHDSCEAELSYTIDSIEHGTEEGDSVFMDSDQISAFTEANGDVIDAAVLEAL